MAEIIDLLQRGVGLYERLVGVTRDKVSGQFTLGQFDARRQLEALDEALSLDPSGVTAVLLLRYYTEREVGARSFSWLELLRKPELAAQLDLPRGILAVIESPMVSAASSEFQAQLAKALTRYEAADRPAVQQLLAQPDNLAFLRRDALRSMQTLRVDQFLDGDNDPEGTLPVYAKVVHQWWNINSMIEHMTRLPSGVSLNLIRAPDGYSSYFAFAIRNGGRLFILSDIDPGTHPLQNMMSRRPDRDLARRIARNWFPYELLNLQYTEDGRRLYIEEASKCTALAARQSNTIPLQAVADLDPESLVWVAMMFELILEKFWKQGYRAPALSYTGEMIRQEATLLGAARTAGLPVPAYEGLGLTPLTKAAITQDTPEVTGALGACPANQNQWMLERYGDQCSAESLNLLAAPADVFLIGDADNLTVKTVSGAALATAGHFERQDLLNVKHRLHQLNVTAFGTKEQLDQDRIWLARHNWATQVQAAAEKEFTARREEVLAWYRERVQANLPRLLTLVGHGALWRRFDELTFGDHASVPTAACYSQQGSGHAWLQIMQVRSREEVRGAGGCGAGWWQGFALPQAKDHEPPCAFTGAKPSYMATFYPVEAEDIAFFAGCSVSELPDVLQHFDGVERYTGNSILRRIDPAVSVLDNPWLKLELRVRVGLSKRGLKQAQAVKDDALTAPYYLTRESVA